MNLYFFISQQVLLQFYYITSLNFSKASFIDFFEPNFSTYQLSSTFISIIKESKLLFFADCYTKVKFIQYTPLNGFLCHSTLKKCRFLTIKLPHLLGKLTHKPCILSQSCVSLFIFQRQPTGFNLSFETYLHRQILTVDMYFILK